jgi:tetratricopeptide (TPR) repeat protein
MRHDAVEQAQNLVRLGDFDGARGIAEEALEHIGDRGNATNICRLHFVRAQVMALRGCVEEAVIYLESVPFPPDDDIESRAMFMMHRASLAGFLGRYETSHRLFEEAEVLASREAAFEVLGEIYLSRAFIFFRQKDYGSSDTLFRAALNIAEQASNWYFRGHGLWGVGKNLMIQGHYQEALPWLEESLAIFETAGARLSIAMVWGELGVCCLGQGDDARALDLFQRAATIEEEFGAVHNYQVSLASIGNVFLHRSHYLTAISYYQRALAIAREIKDPVSIKKWTRNINLAYARIRLSVDETNPRIA